MGILITGGCGFIGSHLCESLYKQGHSLRILDNFSTGSKENIRKLFELDSTESDLHLLRGDCTNPRDVKRILENVETVFHFAANPEIRLDVSNAETCLHQNIYATHVLLEQVKNCPEVHTIIFASTSTVYGDAEIIPTPENYGPLIPISIYGASKLASEALVTAYAHTYNKKAVILRFANIIGPRSQHGVTFDLVRKLSENPSNLEVLGDGKQKKSYLHIDDCIDAIETSWETADETVEILNVGSEDQIEVSKIAEIVIREMGLRNVRVLLTGGVNGGRGWKGDVKNMQLDITRLKEKGWSPKCNSAEAVKRAVRAQRNSITNTGNT